MSKARKVKAEAPAPEARDFELSFMDADCGIIHVSDWRGRTIEEAIKAVSRTIKHYDWEGDKPIQVSIMLKEST